MEPMLRVPPGVHSPEELATKWRQPKTADGVTARVRRNLRGNDNQLAGLGWTRRRTVDGITRLRMAGFGRSSAPSMATVMAPLIGSRPPCNCFADQKEQASW
jgi:hypothetical protein